MKRCVVLNVYKNDAIAHLQSIAHDERCATNQPMPNKAGTQAMLNAAIYFIKHRFKKVEYISLEDASSFQCAGKMVYTSNMSFLLHVKTWYERYFNAFPYEKEAYHELKAIYTSIIQPKMPFDVLWKELLFISKLPEDELKTLYESSPSYHAFFTEIYRHHQCGPFHFITAIMKTFKPFGTPLTNLYFSLWYISVKEVVAKEPKDAYVISVMKKAEYPPMEWESLEIIRNRQYGGTEGRRMYLGQCMDWDD